MRAGRSRSRCCWWRHWACSARVIATSVRGLDNDVYFQVGLLTTVGLAVKNAILIVEFAKEFYEQGATLREAALQAARERLRPILMTSLAFVCGVFPAGDRERRRRCGADRHRHGGGGRHGHGHSPGDFLRPGVLRHRAEAIPGQAEGEA